MADGSQIASKSIQNGADALIALIEEENKKSTARIQQELDQVKGEFAKHRERSAQVQADLEQQLRAAERAAVLANDALEKVVTSAAAAKGVASRARKGLSSARKSLVQIKSALEVIGVTFDENEAIQNSGEPKIVFRPLPMMNTNQDEANTRAAGE